MCKLKPLILTRRLCSEDDDDDEETEGQTEAQKAAKPTEGGSGEPRIKPDPEGRTSASKSKDQFDKDDRGFRIYADRELAKDSQGALQANIQSLDG